MITFAGLIFALLRNVILNAALLILGSCVKLLEFMTAVCPSRRCYLFHIVTSYINSVESDLTLGLGFVGVDFNSEFLQAFLTVKIDVLCDFYFFQKSFRE